MTKKAEKATPGKRKFQLDYEQGHEFGNKGIVIGKIFTSKWAQDRDDVIFTCLCSPEVITALCRMLLKYHEALEQVEAIKPFDVPSGMQAYTTAREVLAAAGKDGEAG